VITDEISVSSRAITVRANRRERFVGSARTRGELAWRERVHAATENDGRDHSRRVIVRAHREIRVPIEPLSERLRRGVHEEAEDTVGNGEGKRKVTSPSPFLATVMSPSTGASLSSAGRLDAFQVRSRLYIFPKGRIT